MKSLHIPFPSQMIAEEDLTFDDLEDSVLVIASPSEASLLSRAGSMGELAEAPVARRTRARAPLDHMTLEELEALLQVGGRGARRLWRVSSIAT